MNGFIIQPTELPYPNSFFNIVLTETISLNPISKPALCKQQKTKLEINKGLIMYIIFKI